jgi:hypothetical protein
VIFENWFVRDINKFIMEKKFDPIKNVPVVFEVFDKDGKSVFKTKSLNKASDELALTGSGKLVATDSDGNTKELTL